MTRKIENMDPSVERYLILEKLGVDTDDYTGEKLEDYFEQAALEAIMYLVPENLASEIEGSWITVMSYDEQPMSAEGRMVVEIAGVDSLVLTKESTGEPDEYAWTAWVKI